MPGAASRECSECGTLPSKYNCKDCLPITSTCSLACSKKHQSEGHRLASQATSIGKGKGREVLPSFTTSTAHHPRSSVNSNGVSTYVPINSYHSDQFQRDFNYLNQVATYVSDLGRDLLNKRMIPQEMMNSNNSNKHKDKNDNNNTIMGAAQHKREALRKQLHFRGLSVLLLPEGMEMRKKNGTNWLHKEQKMIYTVELRFPLAVWSLRGSLSVDAPSPVTSSSVAINSSQSSSTSDKVILLNKQSGESILERLILQELEKRTIASESKSNSASVDKTALATLNNNDGRMQIDDDAAPIPTAAAAVDDDAVLIPTAAADTSLLSLTKTDVSKQEAVLAPIEVDQTDAPTSIIPSTDHSTSSSSPNTGSIPSADGLSNQSMREGKLSNRARKKLKKEANAAQNTTALTPGSASSSNDQPQNQKKNKGRGKNSDCYSRILDTNFDPNFRISARIWAEVGIEVQDLKRQNDRDADANEGGPQNSETRLYQRLPACSVLLLPIFDSRLRNETTLKHLDWFERQKAKGEDEARYGSKNPSRAEVHRNERDDAVTRGKANGRSGDGNSNNIPLGKRNSQPQPQPSTATATANANANANANVTTSQTPIFQIPSPNIPHYAGPPPTFVPTSSLSSTTALSPMIPHYSGPPPPFHPSLPRHPASMNGRANGSSNRLAPTSTAPVVQPPVIALQSNASTKKNPLVSSTLLSKLSGMIPNSNKANTDFSSVNTGGGMARPDPNAIKGMSQESLDHLEKSAAATTLFESMSTKAESLNGGNTGARSNEDTDQQQRQHQSLRFPDHSNQAASGEPATRDQTQTQTEFQNRRPRTLLSIAAHDSLEKVLKNLPEGYAVVEYATIELWPLKRVEEMKERGEVEIKNPEGDKKAMLDGRVEPEPETGAKGMNKSETGNEKKRPSGNSQDGFEISQREGHVEKKVKLESSASKEAASRDHSRPVERVATALSSNQKPLSNLVSYRSDSEDEEEEGSEEGSSKLDRIAASELLSSNGQVKHKENNMQDPEDEEDEAEEEVSYGSGLAGLARAFGLTPVVDQSKESRDSRKADKAAANTMTTQRQDKDVAEAIVEVVNEGDEEELDWGEDE